MSIKLTVSEIVGITGGQLLCGDPGTIIDTIQYDRNTYAHTLCE